MRLFTSTDILNKRWQSETSAHYLGTKVMKYKALRKLLRTKQMDYLKTWNSLDVYFKSCRSSLTNKKKKYNRKHKLESILKTNNSQTMMRTLPSHFHRRLQDSYRSMNTLICTVTTGANNSTKSKMQVCEELISCKHNRKNKSKRTAKLKVPSEGSDADKNLTRIKLSNCKGSSWMNSKWIMRLLRNTSTTGSHTIKQSS